MPLDMPRDAPPHVLLVTERPFLSPGDGSAQNYLSWFHALRDLGCAVSVLSLNRFSSAWSAREIDELRRLTRSTLILDAYPNRGAAVAELGAMTLWRALAGKRYLPLAFERLLGRRRRDQIAKFLRSAPFDAIVVHKLHTAALMGRESLRALPAAKLIDMHDNYPQRERFNAQILLALTRRHPRLFRSIFHPKDFLPAATWARVPRLLKEEAALLADFDRVVFNAPEEAGIYAEAGVPRAKLAILPTPRPVEPQHTDPSPRPFHLGFIAGAALPNVEAAAFLAREILPKLAPLPLRLLVAGPIGPQAARLLPPETTTITGWIDDVATFYRQVEIVLVPLRTGTGVSVKTVEAAAHGAAIVATAIGARGVALEPGRDLLIADTAADFAAAISRLLEDPALRTALRRNATAAFLRGHSREAFTAGLQSILRTSLRHPASAPSISPQHSGN